MMAAGADEQHTSGRNNYRYGNRNGGFSCWQRGMCSCPAAGGGKVLEKRPVCGGNVRFEINVAA